jgi:hypothetical protein
VTARTANSLLDRQDAHSPPPSVLPGTGDDLFVMAPPFFTWKFDHVADVRRGSHCSV